MNATVSLIKPLYSNGTLSMEFGTLSMELSCLYFKRLLVKVSIKDVFLSLKIVFIIPNGANPGEVSYCEPFHQGLYCLFKYLLWKELKVYNHMKCTKCKTFAKDFSFVNSMRV